VTLGRLCTNFIRVLGWWTRRAHRHFRDYSKSGAAGDSMKPKATAHQGDAQKVYCTRRIIANSTARR
jgi:hypothetical protein